MLGVAGIAISMLAYVPQVVHLGREHCSAGVSRRAWAMWLVSSVLIGTLAVYRQDPVFILLQMSTLTSAAIILFLAHKYRGMVCGFHRPSSADIREFADRATSSSRARPQVPARASSSTISNSVVGPRRSARDAPAAPDAARGHPRPRAWPGSTQDVPGLGWRFRGGR
jgi:lipid-A-disaccharide synthase-like uncharacterized protein